MVARFRGGPIARGRVADRGRRELPDARSPVGRRTSQIQHLNKIGRHFEDDLGLIAAADSNCCRAPWMAGSRSGLMAGRQGWRWRGWRPAMWASRSVVAVEGDDAGDGVTLDELALAPGGFAEGGGGDTIDVA